LSTTERTSSAADTEALGARIAAGLGPGDVVLVAGELGAGKTTLIRGACRELGVEEAVTSPTFTIGHRYHAGSHAVSHLDLYRLGALEAEEPGLLDDYLTSDAVSFVEWPQDLPQEVGLARLEGVRLASRVELRHAGGDEREVVID
jgi:tRNA threonylcarbamoyladenosine biosynthesis protein TsaE